MLAMVLFIQFEAFDDKNELTKGKRYGRCDSVVREDVGDDGHLGGDLDVAPQELSEQRRDGTASEPVAEGVEDKLVAAVGILLPASKFIVDSERDAFFKSTIVVCGKTNNKTAHLQTQRDVEVFRHVRLRPKEGAAILLPRDGLNGLPADKGVVTDEWSAVTTANCELNRGVDEVGEVGDAVLEDIVDNLQNTRCVLQ